MDKVIQTQEIIPRYYGIVFERKQGNLFIIPTSFAFGEVLRKSPNELKEYVAEWQKHKSEHLEKYTQGQHVYRPLFPINGYEDLLYCKPDFVVESILDGITKKHGSKNLWMVGGEEAIKKGYIGASALTAEVKARHHGGKKGSKTYWSVEMDSPLDFDGLPKYDHEFCQCWDSYWGIVKRGTHVVCAHIAAAIDQLYDDDLNLIKDKNTEKRKVWLPFNFIDRPNEVDRSLIAPHIEFEDQPDPAVLIIDVLTSAYVKNDRLFDINKKLAKIPAIYNRNLERLIEDGKAYYGVLHQRKKSKRMNPEYEYAIRNLKKQMETKLLEMGFERKKIDVLEFADTPWETVCPEYINKEKSIRLVFNNQFPPVYTTRNVREGETNMFLPIYDMRHPFSKLNKRFTDRDDKTKKIGKTKVIIPSKMNIPEILKPIYIGFVNKYHPGDTRQVSNFLKENGL